ncbi:mannose-6-phosphate isomerase, type 2 [Desulforamulus reducens MI-1]|uniref:mannose-1-phosphate guanylyltransferase n=1 Tax=Desulforamulus reducens (strain ATCC BAA-1160 / DSM 100696 / MI-1) TaxID=349161 RepID=A4J4C4_DESRM|nr:mannose-1-phosphate guanylyltransferase/mannose-6-phosphate isomerase [Desulforamulus reducens]ABO49927.1 mannose-6-phosphate isomerase, type 2 [Desulforamulus reducens MI-1]
MKVIILAGGIGTRLWPLSRTNYPKQFLKIKKMARSIFQMTYERCLKLTDHQQIYIVTNINYKFLVVGQIEELGHQIDDRQILIEPVGKNTLPAIYYGVKEIQKQGDDITVVFPSDHLIKDEERFINTIKQGENLADQYIITFGICPTKPHTGYGYIKPKEPLQVGNRVDQFKEKPDKETAVNYLAMGYLWNSGMFMFRTDIFCQEVKEYLPDVCDAFKSPNILDIYDQTPSVSIDYGLMEKSKNVAVIPLDVHWSDLGSFDAFYDEFDVDEQGNLNFDKDILIDSSNNMLYSNKEKAVALIGVHDLILVDQKDALLVCRRDHSQRVKEVVDRLKELNDPRADYHLTAYRPWGSYTILEEGFFYKIKRITVLPGKKLSYQLHHHRSEHWVVVKGTAKVTIEGKETFVRSGESTFVQTGFKHRLENPGKVLLEVIEVQLGEYLNEDDIVRLDDDFGRSSGTLE